MKKTYNTPKLTNYGDIEKITLGRGGNPGRGDDPKPKKPKSPHGRHGS